MLIKKLLVVAAFFGALVASSANAAFLTNWYFNPAGTGFAGGTKITEYLDINLSSLVNTTVPNMAGAFSFSEYGTFFSAGHDGLPGYVNPVTMTNFLGAGQVTGVFSLSGTGVLSGAIAFAPGGTIDLWASSATQPYGTAAGIYGADAGTNFADLVVLAGGGSIDATGVPNGQQTLIAAITALTAGYWFDSSGVDLSTIVPSLPPLLLGFTTVNASVTTTEIAAPFNSEMVSGLGASAYTGCLPGLVVGPCTGAGSFNLAANGQQRLAVPEPGSVALLGLVAIAVAGFSRRRRVA